MIRFYFALLCTLEIILSCSLAMNFFRPGTTIPVRAFNASLPEFPPQSSLLLSTMTAGLQTWVAYKQQTIPHVKRSQFFCHWSICTHSSTVIIIDHRFLNARIAIALFYIGQKYLLSRIHVSTWKNLLGLLHLQSLAKSSLTLSQSFQNVAVGYFNFGPLFVRGAS